MVIWPFWAVTTPVRTARTLEKYLRLRLRHPRNRRTTVCVRPIPITVWHAPLLALPRLSELDVAFEMDEVEMVEEEPWDDNDSDMEADVDGGVSEYER